MILGTPAHSKVRASAASSVLGAAPPQGMLASGLKSQLNAHLLHDVQHGEGLTECLVQPFIAER